MQAFSEKPLHQQAPAELRNWNLMLSTSQRAFQQHMADLRQECSRRAFGVSCHVVLKPHRLQLFKEDALRYPVLLILGASFSGKTEFAKSLFESPLELKIGSLTFFPDRLREFERGVHDGLVLDDVRDLKFLTDNQDRLQGKYDSILEFASTPGGQCKYSLYLFRVPIVCTANYSTSNLAFLENHDWLSKPSNCRVVHWNAAWCEQ